MSVLNQMLSALDQRGVSVDTATSAGVDKPAPAQRATVPCAPAEPGAPPSTARTLVLMPDEPASAGEPARAAAAMADSPPPRYVPAAAPASRLPARAALIVTLLAAGAGGAYSLSLPGSEATVAATPVAAAPLRVVAAAPAIADVSARPAAITDVQPTTTTSLLPAAGIDGAFALTPGAAAIERSVQQPAMITASSMERPVPTAAPHVAHVVARAPRDAATAVPASATRSQTVATSAGSPPAARATTPVLLAPQPTESRSPMQLASIAPPRSPGPAEALDAVIAPPVVRRTEVSDPSVQVARAADLIARGRTLEARPLLRQTLESRPDHHDARAALVALLAEAGERDTALQLLLDGSRIEPARFAASAAQLQFALGDAEGALATLNRVPAAARTAALNALAAGIAQQAGKHELSVALYEAALAADPAPATWWLGLGFAFDAVGRRSDAANALKKALSGEALPGPARAAARERLAALGG